MPDKSDKTTMNAHSVGRQPSTVINNSGPTKGGLSKLGREPIITPLA
jgi:hypothetical protein